MRLTRAERWARIRQQGKLNFIFRAGLIYGLFLFLFMWLFDAVLLPRLFPAPPRLTPLFQRLEIRLLTWLLAGFVYASLMWWWSERQYGGKR
jgi:hypothetical protein